MLKTKAVCLFLSHTYLNVNVIVEVNLEHTIRRYTRHENQENI